MHRGRLLLLAGLAVSGVSLLQAAPGPVSPPVAMARLKAAEARIRTGVIRYRSAGRSVKWDGDVDETAGRRELARGGKDYGSSSSTLRFAGGAWCEKGVFTSAAGVTT